MADFNFFTFVFDVMFKIVEMGRWAYSFLFYKFNILTYTVAVWELLGGALATTLIIATVVKAVAPLI